MVKVVKTRVEIEGEVHEETVVVEQDEPQAWEAGREFGMVGKPLNRVDAQVGNYVLPCPAFAHALALRAPKIMGTGSAYSRCLYPLF